MEIFIIRRENLAKLCDQHGGQAQLSNLLDLKQPQINRWLSLKSQDPRKITEQSARKIEHKLGLDQGWMDSRHDLIVDPDNPQADTVEVAHDLNQPVADYRPDTNRDTVHRIIDLLPDDLIAVVLGYLQGLSDGHQSHDSSGAHTDWKAVHKLSLMLSKNKSEVINRQK